MDKAEVLKVAGECFSDKQYSAITYESGPYDIDNPTVGLMRFAAAMYAAGAADMKERAANAADALGVHPNLNVYNGGPDWYKHGKAITKAIRALPITQTNPVEGEQA